MAELKLKELREQENLSQRDLTSKLNILPMTYNNYEKNRCEPNIDTLIKIADFYKVSLDYVCNHKTIGANDIGYLNDQQRQLIELIKELNELNTIKAISYISGLIAGQ